ncbi:MAG: hypothetical protein J5836_03770, partial [Clostridia bacterium]|nr:hypothetical protein [Clostridia bacterium]
TEYLKGDCVLLGTQRDIRRLTVRNASFIAKPIEKFCDLFQYVAITSSDKTKRSYAERVAKYIYENSGDNLSAIGMLPIKNNFYDGALGAYDTSLTEYTLSPFTADSVLEELNEALGGKKTAEERAEKLKNTVKHL